MDLTLPDELQQFIEACVREGFYSDHQDVVRDAVRHLFAEMTVNEEPVVASLPALDAGSDDEAALASLIAATGDLGSDAEPTAATGDAMLERLDGVRSRLLSLLEAVERDIAANSTDGTAAERLNVSMGIGSPEEYVTLRIPRSNEPGVWRSQALAAPRGHLVLEDLQYARSDLFMALAEVNQAESQRLEMLLDRYGRAMQTLSALLGRVGQSNAAIVKKLR